MLVWKKTRVSALTSDAMMIRDLIYIRIRNFIHVGITDSNHVGIIREFI